MSLETLQFVEMVRQAAAKLSQQPKPAGYLLYCEQCDRNTRHSLKVEGDWEVYTCPVCGRGKGYRVR